MNLIYIVLYIVIYIYTHTYIYRGFAVVLVMIYNFRAIIAGGCGESGSTVADTSVLSPAVPFACFCFVSYFITTCPVFTQVVMLSDPPSPSIPLYPPPTHTHTHHTHHTHHTYFLLYNLPYTPGSYALVVLLYIVFLYFIFLSFEV